MPHVRCPSWSVGSCKFPLILVACEFPVGRSTPNPTTMRLRNDGRKLYFAFLPCKQKTCGRPATRKGVGRPSDQDQKGQGKSPGPGNFHPLQGRTHLFSSVSHA